MKIQKTVSMVLAFMLVLVMSFTVSNSYAQAKTKHTTMKDGCMMKEGKMMVMKHGKTMPMKMDMTMNNGTICMTTGECKMKSGKSMMMKEGDCIEMSGKMGNCAMMNKGMKGNKMHKDMKGSMMHEGMKDSMMKKGY
ncbi:MAG: DUF6799 domain-containing protein [Chitinophagaceae bacterium]